MIRIRERGIAALAVLTLLAVACEGAGDEGPSPQPSEQAGAQTFTYSVTSEVMIGWDPATGYSNEVIAMHNLYETLTRYDSATQQVEPLLAESWERSNGRWSSGRVPRTSGGP
jgi:peptide/nickel transport system substrate-binding protein